VFSAVVTLSPSSSVLQAIPSDRDFTSQTYVSFGPTIASLSFIVKTIDELPHQYS